MVYLCRGSAAKMEADSITKANELFRSLPISQIKEINDSLEVQANDKTNQLRTLVGSKYRSLLLTAENIILMNSIVQQDKKLAYLSDLNDTQGVAIDKTTKNYQTFISLNLSKSSNCQNTRVLFRSLLLNLQFSVDKLINTIEKCALKRLLNGNSALQNQCI